MKKKIEIFHNVVWSKYKGGVFSALHTLVSEKNEFDVKFCQIAETDSDRVGLSGVDPTYHTYPYRLLFSGSYSAVPRPKRIATLFLQVWRSESDLVVLPCYDKPEYWAMWVAALLRRKKRAVFVDSTIHDRRQYFWKGVLKRLFLRRCHGVFAYGSRARDYVVGHGAHPRTVFQRCQAAALPHQYTVESAMTSRLESAPSPDAPRFLYVGRLSPEKSLDGLFHAFANVLRMIPGATLIVVGAGPQRHELESLSSFLQLESAIEFTGGMDAGSLGKEYASATCLVLPSESEPWGLVANEALSYGCPVIVSDRCGCVPELVVEGETGFIFSWGDVRELTARMVSAPTAFADTEATATRCLQVIAQFTPAKAAAQIIDGCRVILDR